MINKRLTEGTSSLSDCRMTISGLESFENSLEAPRIIITRFKVVNL